jgi:hypothetical protein
MQLRLPHNQAQRRMSDISKVFKENDISTFWLAISGIIRVKTSPVSLYPRGFHPRLRRNDIQRLKGSFYIWSRCGEDRFQERHWSIIGSERSAQRWYKNRWGNGVKRTRRTNHLSRRLEPRCVVGRVSTRGSQPRHRFLTEFLRNLPVR